MKLRPHHIIDIVTDYGNNVHYEPHPYGHSQHLVAPKLLSDLAVKFTLVLEADDICKGCTNLMDDRKCRDVLGQLNPSPSKQAYNDVLDSRLFDHFRLTPGYTLTFQEYLEILNERTPGLEKICTHPKEEPAKRLRGLIKGLTRLGVRNKMKKNKN